MISKAPLNIFWSLKTSYLTAFWEYTKKPYNDGSNSGTFGASVPALLDLSSAFDKLVTRFFFPLFHRSHRNNHGVCSWHQFIPSSPSIYWSMMKKFWVFFLKAHDIALSFFYPLLQSTEVRFQPDDDPAFTMHLTF